MTFKVYGPVHIQLHSNKLLQNDNSDNKNFKGQLENVINREIGT